MDHYGSTSKITSTPESGLDNSAPATTPNTANNTPYPSPTLSPVAGKASKEAPVISSRPRRGNRDVQSGSPSSGNKEEEAEILKRKREAREGLAFLDEEQLPPPKRRTVEEHTRGIAIRKDPQKSPSPKATPKQTTASKESTNKKGASKKPNKYPVHRQQETPKPQQPISGKALDKDVVLSETTTTRQVNFFGKTVKHTQTIKTIGPKPNTTAPTPGAAPIKASPSLVSTKPAPTATPKKALEKAALTSRSESGKRDGERTRPRPVLPESTYVGTAFLKNPIRPILKELEPAKVAKSTTTPTPAPAPKQTSVDFNALRAQRRVEANMKRKVIVDPRSQKDIALEMRRERENARENGKAPEKKPNNETNPYARRW